jgi:tRNA(fMet)-specific endonuclease VapC
MIDTNVAIHARDGSEAVYAKLLEHPGEVVLSALSLAEMQWGLYASAEHVALRRARLAELLEAIPVVPFGRDAAEAYGAIVGALGWSLSRQMDRLIAAHALVIPATLVTAKATDFRNVPGLEIENWLAP